jgi:hypothetical protein
MALLARIKGGSSDTADNIRSKYQHVKLEETTTTFPERGGKA